MVTLIDRPRVGRPPKARRGTIVGGGDGGRLAWAAGHWAGTPRFVVAARRMCADREVLPVPGTGAWVEADALNAVAVVAVIAALVGIDGHVTGDLPRDQIYRLAVMASQDPDEVA